MDGIDQFIKQQNQMLQIEKNNLSFLESAQAQHTLEHAKAKTQMVDDSTSVADDKKDDEEQERILHLGKHPSQTTLATDDDKGKKHFAEQYVLSAHSSEVNDQGIHRQSETDSRNQQYQLYLAEMANKESLEFRRKIGANVQYHHDQEVQLHENQRDFNQANNRQYDHDKGKKHFEEQYATSPHSNEFNDQGKHNQNESDIRRQEYQVYLAEEANKESLEFRRKIGANVQYHHDQELQQHENQRDVNQVNSRQHDYDHDKGKKHFEEQHATSPHSTELNDQGKHNQNESDIRHQEHQVYLAEEANKESLEFRRKIGADVQYHHQRHDHELQQHQHQRDVNIRAHDHERKHGHDLIDIERDIHSSGAQNSHQGLNGNLSHYDFSGTKYNADAIIDRNKEQVKVDHRKKMEYKRGLKKQIEEKNLEHEQERQRFEETNLAKNAHNQSNPHQQFYPLRQNVHDAPRCTEGGL